jgi:hypothetical protein
MTADVPPTVVTVALEAIPSLEGLQVNWEVNAG